LNLAKHITYVHQHQKAPAMSFTTFEPRFMRYALQMLSSDYGGCYERALLILVLLIAAAERMWRRHVSIIL